MYLRHTSCSCGVQRRSRLTPQFYLLPHSQPFRVILSCREIVARQPPLNPFRRLSPVLSFRYVAEPSSARLRLHGTVVRIRPRPVAPLPALCSPLSLSLLSTLEAALPELQRESDAGRKKQWCWRRREAEGSDGGH